MRDLRSALIIFVYTMLNLTVAFYALTRKNEVFDPQKVADSLAPEFTQISELEYFLLKNQVPQISLVASEMQSQGDLYAEFENPQGLYNYQKRNETLKYQAERGNYKKDNELLKLNGAVKIKSSDADYFADEVKYFLKKDLVLGKGNVRFIGSDPKSHDSIKIDSETMRAHPERQYGLFEGHVKGEMERKKKYEGKMNFTSRVLELEGDKSLAHLEGDVWMKRQSYLITSGKADIFMENYNQSLKYFVMNDDVKLTETLQTPEGTVERKAYAERLEGFGREQKMVLSGAPRVEQGKDVIKGYRITFREQVDLLEVDDAMSDVQVMKKKKKE